MISISKNFGISFLIIIFLLVPISIDAKIRLSQENYTMDLSSNELTLTYDDEIKLTIDVYADGTPLPGVFFEIVSIPVSIGETQYDLGNGSYIINFTKSLLQDVPAGNYTGSIYGILEGDTIIESQFTLNLYSTDNINPSLVVSSPVSPVTASNINVQLIGYDQNGWLDLSVRSGDQVLYYLRNTGEVVNRSELAYNQSHISLQKSINIRQNNVSLISDLVIEIRDIGYNVNSTTLELTGDFIIPVITWLSHQNGNTVNTNPIILRWEISDTSTIFSQQMAINGEILAGGTITSDSRSRTVDLTEYVGQDGQIFIELRVNDSSDNTAIAHLRLYFESTVDQHAESQIGNIIEEPQNRILLLMLFTIFIGIIGVVFYLIYSQKWGSSSSITKVPSSIQTLDPDAIVDGLDVDFGSSEENTNRIRTLLIREIEELKHQNTKENIRLQLNLISNLLDQIRLDESLEKEFREILYTEMGTWINNFES